MAEPPVEYQLGVAVSITWRPWRIVQLPRPVVTQKTAPLPAFSRLILSPPRNGLVSLI